MKFPILNIDGTKSNTIEVSDKIVKIESKLQIDKICN